MVTPLSVAPGPLVPYSTSSVPAEYCEPMASVPVPSPMIDVPSSSVSVDPVATATVPVFCTVSASRTKLELIVGEEPDPTITSSFGTGKPALQLPPSDHWPSELPSVQVSVGGGGGD